MTTASDMVPTVRESQGKSKYQGAIVNKDAEKNFELFYADCIQQFTIFSACFTRRLFVSTLLNLFRHLCF